MWSLEFLIIFRANESDNFFIIMKTRGTLLAAICDFGWGSLGKFRLVLDSLPFTEIVLYGDAQINVLASDVLVRKHRLVHRSASAADVALVINDPVLADNIAALSVPVVYVDSLPYLWASASEIPARSSVATYCAQKFPTDRMPISKQLSDWKNILWIDPIVPKLAQRKGGCGIVINLGGLHSHCAGDAVTAYLRLVLIPLVEAVRYKNWPVAGVCGNLPADIRKDVSTLLPDCGVVGPCAPCEFEQLLINADYLFTSPGSTTILQALMLGIPTQLLPPQNLSQILNVRLFSRSNADTLTWPNHILDLRKVDALRPRGETEVLHYIYGAICEAQASDYALFDMATSIHAAMHTLPNEGVLDSFQKRLGDGGATQVAAVLDQYLSGQTNMMITGG